MQAIARSGEKKIERLEAEDITIAAVFALSAGLSEPCQYDSITTIVWQIRRSTCQKCQRVKKKIVRIRGGI